MRAKIFSILKFKIKFFIALYFRKNKKFQKNHYIYFLKKRIKFPLTAEKIYYKNMSKLSHFYFFFFFFLFYYLNNRSDISKSIFL